VKSLRKRRNFNFWAELPHEIAVRVLQVLKPKEIVRLNSLKGMA
jgi:transcriptional regulator of acetoin/glycerol metabolism